ncbi:hypothetical protein HZH66_008768 [Vespula vulgaris]|uniref:Uncharacterized protein n=1 Tax=Vespula vulgaris TaxID=7454 RepID=A0A834JRS3_VESVU|nr:hypothetical protein HZH66_008768 [Vespula vulgaris]
MDLRATSVRSTSSIQLEGVHPFELPRFDSHLQHQCTGKVRGDEEMKRKRRRRNSQGIEKSMHRHAGMGLREAERIFKESPHMQRSSSRITKPFYDQILESLIKGIQGILKVVVLYRPS